jgi:hypothetical protein
MTRSSAGGRQHNGQEFGLGLLVDGVWRDASYDTADTGGRFVRKDSAFRNWVLRTVRLVVREAAGSLPPPAGFISMSHWLAPGHTAP